MSDEETSKKLEKLVSKSPSKWIEESDERFAKGKLLREYQRDSLIILRFIRKEESIKKELNSSIGVNQIN